MPAQGVAGERGAGEADFAALARSAGCFFRGDGCATFGMGPSFPNETIRFALPNPRIIGGSFKFSVSSRPRDSVEAGRQDATVARFNLTGFLIGQGICLCLQAIGAPTGLQDDVVKALVVSASIPTGFWRAGIKLRKSGTGVRTRCHAPLPPTSVPLPESAQEGSKLATMKAAYPKPEQWASAAVPFLASLGPRHNEQALTVSAPR
jgi:hypothetical protein